jgi:penicillin-binding protein A
MNANIRRLGAFFLLAFGLIVVDVTYWQVIGASGMTARADNPRLRLDAASVRRGLILDRNGVLLAGRNIDSNGNVHRSYQDLSLSQVIGYDSDRYGKSGLEKIYDQYLTGKVAGTDWQTVIDQWEHKKVVGDNLTLTIDDRLQRQVAALLPNSPSAAVVSDPRTGEILAMVSKPSFDANRLGDPAYWNALLHNPDSPLVNRPLNGYYPPGSTFKIVTLSAALDSGLMTLGQQFSGQAATGPLTVDFHMFPAAINNLPNGITSVSLEQALMYSDNIVFAQVGLALGSDRFLSYTHQFGLDQSIPFDLPVSVSHVQTAGETFSQVELASSAFGQGGLHVTPLQMLLADEAIADHGSIPRPVLVKQVTAPDGSVVHGGAYGELFHAIASSTADHVRGAMVQVVEAGSGFNARLPGVKVAAKTGTAETGPGQTPHAWFVCFAPADHPRVAIAIIVEHGGEGAFVAAPIARRILEAALPLIP